MEVLALGLVAAIVVVVLQWRAAAALRRRHAQLLNEMTAREEEIHHLATVRLPALAEGLVQPAVPVPGPLHPHLAACEYGHSLKKIMTVLEHSVRAAQTHADRAARTTLMATMRGVQGLASEQRVAISAMQGRYDNEAVLADLLGIDHLNAQIGRRAQAVGVLCRAWPGQQRGNVTLEDVVRGATSRIRDYLRVNTVAHTDVAVTGRVVEPVVLAVAELLDNATRYSPPRTPVEVNISLVHNGAVITVDDRGIGMHDHDKPHANRVLSGARAVDVTQLGNPPKIGFSVIGALSRRYGFRVTVDFSPYGGVRAVVLLPSELLTRPDTKELPATPPTVAPDPAQPSRAPQGLPQRRRRVADPALQGGAAPSAPMPAVPARSATHAAAVAAAFQHGPQAARPLSHESEGISDA